MDAFVFDLFDLPTQIITGDVSPEVVVGVVLLLLLLFLCGLWWRAVFETLGITTRTTQVRQPPVLPSEEDLEIIARSMRRRAGARGAAETNNNNHGEQNQDGEGGEDGAEAPPMVYDRGTDDTCGICLGEPIQDAVELLPCTHLMCAACAVDYLRATRSRLPFPLRTQIKCPYDRRPVELILPAFRHRRLVRQQQEQQRPADAAAAAAAADGNNNHTDTTTANNNGHNNTTLYCPHDRELLEYSNIMRNTTAGTNTWGGAPALVGFIRRNFGHLPRPMQARIIALVMIAVGYLVSPWDLLPEAGLPNPLVGLIDDSAVIVGIVFVSIPATIGYVLR